MPCSAMRSKASRTSSRIGFAHRVGIERYGSVLLADSRDTRRAERSVGGEQGDVGVVGLLLPFGRRGRTVETHVGAARPVGAQLVFAGTAVVTNLLSHRRRSPARARSLWRGSRSRW